MAHDTRTGAKLTTLRDSLGLTVEQVAQRSGCDVAVIQQLEAGELAPSLAPLIKITRALGCRLGTLLDDDAQMGPVVTRGDGERVGRPPAQPRDRHARPRPARVLLAGGRQERAPHGALSHSRAARRRAGAVDHEGEEVIYVLDGSIEIEYGKDLHVLGVGDSIYYDSIVPHQVRAAGTAAATILAVIYAPF